LARGFLSRGDAVLAVGRSEESFESLEAEIQDLNLSCDQLRNFRVNLLDQEAAQLITEAVEEGGQGDIVLVNNARNRGNLLQSPGSAGSRNAFAAEYALGVIVPYELSMALSRRFGSRLTAVVNIGSQYGLVAQNPVLYEDYHADSTPHYGVTKAGLFQLTRELSVRLGHLGTRVNAIALGGVRGRVTGSSGPAHPVCRLRDLAAPGMASRGAPA
jgi:NAD(P)-dependent dehydrogenase (short-subunit alcohol dehydrogenase family)